MKLLKQEDGTVVQVQEISTPISIQSIDVRIEGLKSMIENFQVQLKELELAKVEFEKISK